MLMTTTTRNEIVRETTECAAYDYLKCVTSIRKCHVFRIYVHKIDAANTYVARSHDFGRQRNAMNKLLLIHSIPLWYYCMTAIYKISPFPMDSIFPYLVTISLLNEPMSLSDHRLVYMERPSMASTHLNYINLHKSFSLEFRISRDGSNTVTNRNYRQCCRKRHKLRTQSWCPTYAKYVSCWILCRFSHSVDLRGKIQCNAQSACIIHNEIKCERVIMSSTQSQRQRSNFVWFSNLIIDNSLQSLMSICRCAADCWSFLPCMTHTTCKIGSDWFHVRLMQVNRHFNRHIAPCRRRVSNRIIHMGIQLRRILFILIRVDFMFPYCTSARPFADAVAQWCHRRVRIVNHKLIQCKRAAHPIYMYIRFVQPYLV